VKRRPYDHMIDPHVRPHAPDGLRGSSYGRLHAAGGGSAHDVDVERQSGWAPRVLGRWPAHLGRPTYSSPSHGRRFLGGE
jgi:hypothetical protein